MRAGALLVGAMVIAACAHEKTRAEIEVDEAKEAIRPAEASDARAVAPPAPSALPEGPSQLRPIALLDDSIRRFPDDPRVPRWLFAAGAEGVRVAFFFPETADDSAYWAVLSHAYEWREPAGPMYTGWHLQTLIERFPGDTLVDDAAFLIAMRGNFVASDCEGHLDCDLMTSLGPWTDFLAAHPSSALVTRALAVSDTALRYHFDRFEPRHARYLAADSLERADDPPRVDAGRVEAVLADFENALSLLPAAERERGLAILAPIRERWKRINQSLTVARPSAP